MVGFEHEYLYIISSKHVMYKEWFFKVNLENKVKWAQVVPLLLEAYLLMIKPIQKRCTNVCIPGEVRVLV